MTENKRFEIYDEENGYVRDNKTDESYSACGGGDGFPFIINEYHKLQEENEKLKEQNRQLQLENGKLTHDLFWANKKIKEKVI